MKWKKKSGSWRAQDEYCQYVIEEIEGWYHPKIKIPDGCWESHRPHLSIEEVKKYCEQLSVLHNEVEAANKKLVGLRREANQGRTRSESRLVEAVKRWVKISEVERIYLRTQLPEPTVKFLDLAKDEINRRTSDENTNSEEGVSK